MLTYSNHNLEINRRWLLSASNTLLGKKKTDEILAGRKSNIGTLLILSLLEKAAEEIKRRSGGDVPEERRWRALSVADEVQHLRYLSGSNFLSTHLPFRIRGKNQKTALLENQIFLGDKERGEDLVRIQIGLRDLGRCVSQVESSGEFSFEVTVSNGLADALSQTFNRAKLGNDHPTTVSLCFRDELPERPESKRLWLGNVINRCLALAKDNKTTPWQELQKLASEEVGRNLTLKGGGRISSLDILERGENWTKLRLSVTFPDIIELLSKANKANGEPAAKGSLTDGQLRLHCAQRYGCNGRNFVEVSKTLADCLESNLREAAIEWFEKETSSLRQVRERIKSLEEKISGLTSVIKGLNSGRFDDTKRKEELEAQRLELRKQLTNDQKALEKELRSFEQSGLIEKFLEQYSGLCLLFPKRFKPLSKLELAQSRIKSTKELVPFAIEGEAMSLADCPEGIYLEEAAGDDKSTYGKPCSIASGSPWLSYLINEELKSTYNTERILNYSQRVEKLFGFTGVREGFRRIEENFLGVRSLDGGAEKVIFETFQLSEELEEEFLEAKEERNQEIFEGKSEEPRDRETGALLRELEKDTWIMEQKPIILELPSRGPALHRLLKYQTPSKSLGPRKTKAQTMDPTLSLPKNNNKPLLSELGKEISLYEILSEQAKSEIQEIEAQGNPQQTRTLKAFTNLLKQWQNSKSIKAFSRNPLERLLFHWFNGLAQGKEEEKIKSFSEIETLVYSSYLNVLGREPWELDKTPEELTNPVISSTLPLELLCGVRERIGPITNDPELLLDLTRRWANADLVNNLPYEKGKEHWLNKLQEAIEKNELEFHCLLAELQYQPDFDSDYLSSIGMPFGEESLPQELLKYGDILYPAQHNPLILNISGEPFPLQDSINYIIENQRREQEFLKDRIKSFEQDLSRLESEQVENPSEKESLKKSYQEAINIFLEEVARKQELIKEVEALSKISLPDGELLIDKKLSQWGEGLEESLRTLMLAEGPIAQEVPTLEVVSRTSGSQGFEGILEVLEETLPGSTNNTKAITQTLLAFNSKRIEVISQTGRGFLRKGSSQTWFPETKAEWLKDIADEVNHVEALLSGKQIPTEQEQKDLQAGKKAAYHSRLLENYKFINLAIENLPPCFKHSKEAKDTLKQALGTTELLDQLSHQRKVVEEVAQAIMELEDQEEDPWRQDTKLTDINILMGKVTKTLNLRTSSQETLALLGSEDIQEVKTLLDGGDYRQAANVLKTRAGSNYISLRTCLAEELQNALKETRFLLQKNIEESKSPRTREVFYGFGGVKRLLLDKERRLIYEPALRKLAAKAQIKNKVTILQGRKKPPLEITTGGSDLFATNGAKTPLHIEMDPATKKIKTNKLWVKAWVETPTGREHLEQRINTTQWISKCSWKGTAPTTALAFIAFCKHRKLYNITHLISKSPDHALENKFVQGALERFEKALCKIGIDSSASLNTKLYAAYAIHQYTQSNYCPEKLWDPEIEKELSQKVIAPQGFQTREWVVEVDPSFKGGVSFPSPFKRQEGVLSQSQIHKEIVESAIRAAENLQYALE